MPDEFRYNFEYAPEEKVRVGYLGCGGHSYRNVYPSFAFAPVELVAVCDRQADRAEAYARQFGATRWHTDHRRLLEDDIEAVFIVTNYDEQGWPQATPLALEALEAGKHVWMEKPPAATVAQLEALKQAADRQAKCVLVGFKKMFTPAMRRLREIIAGESFGGVTSINIRYPQHMPEPPYDGRKMIGFLDHIAHPGAQLVTLGGPLRELFYVRQPDSGATVASLTFAGGAIGCLHLTAGQSGTSPLERVEVIGRGENAVIENGVRLTWYRKGGRGPYGRSDTFTTATEQGPIVWEPEFSLGVLYNKGLFTLGYVEEIRYFCACVKAGRAVERGGLDDAIAIWRLYEAYLQGPGKVIAV